MGNNYICALDIGSSKIAACVAEIKKGRLEKLFFDSVPSCGVREGIIVDSIDLIRAVSKLLKGLRAKSGINIKFIHTNISGRDIVTKHSRAIIPLAERGNKVITMSDIAKVNEQARILGSGLEEEIIHLVPSSYTIDSKSNIRDPIGLYSHKLEVDLFLICGKLSSIQSLSRAINQSGFEIKDLFFSGFATACAVFSRELQEGLNLLCDIGSDITEVSVFKDGVLKDIEILNFGGDALTGQLCETLKIPLDFAEDIKRSYGAIGECQIPEDKEILVRKSDFYKPIKQKLVSQVITSSARLICSGIKEAAEKKVPLYEINNFLIVGRAAALEGFIEMLENTLGIPVKLGRLTNPKVLSLINQDNILSGERYLTYLTCLGMVCLATQNRLSSNMPVYQPTKNLVLKLVNRFKEVYQEYF